jgi:hypothetical protein
MRAETRSGNIANVVRQFRRRRKDAASGAIRGAAEANDASPRNLEERKPLRMIGAQRP